jgi:serine/threonine protein kinase
LEFPSPEWNNITDPAKQFVRACLEKNPTKRSDINQLYNHRWLAIQKSYEELSAEEKKQVRNDEYNIIIILQYYNNSFFLFLEKLMKLFIIKKE